MSEQLSPERAVRLLRAKAAELENRAEILLSPDQPDANKPHAVSFGYIAADIALVAQLLADHIEHCGGQVCGAPNEDGSLHCVLRPGHGPDHECWDRGTIWHWDLR